MKTYIRDAIEQSQQVFSAMAADKKLLVQRETVATVCIAALHGGHKILLAGNGGSAADAQHIAADDDRQRDYDGYCQ